MLLRSQRYTFTILFLLLVALLSWYSRLAADDYYFIYLSNQSGPIGASLQQYIQFSGRWFCHLISCTLLEFSSNRFFLPIYFLLTFTTLYFILSAIFYKLYSRFSLDESDWNSDFASLLLTATFFLCSFSIGENWFWFISTTTYMWSIIFSLILLNIFLKNTHSKFTKPLLVISCIYIGTASESLALFDLILLNIYSAYVIRKESFEFWKNDKQNKYILLAFAILFISFLTSILSPGSLSRNELLPAFSISGRAIVFAKSIFKTFFVYLPDKSWLFLILSGPWMIFGYLIQEEVAIPMRQILKRIGIIILLTIVLVSIALFPTALILGEQGPARALSIVTLIFAISFAALFTHFGMFFQMDKKITLISNFTLFFSIIYLSFQCINQYKTTSVFARFYDERVNALEEMKKNQFKGTAELTPLPEAGFLYDARISDDTAYFVNQHWKLGLGLDFPLAVHKY